MRRSDLPLSEFPGSTFKFDPARIRLISDEPVPEQQELFLGMEVWAEIVAGVATGTDGPFTIGLFAQWGRGKTSVLRGACHRASFSPQTHTFIVNAWEYERHPDPLQPILHEILCSIDASLIASKDEVTKTRLQKLREVFTVLVLGTAAFALGSPALGMLAGQSAGAVVSAAERIKAAKDQMEMARDAIYELTPTGADSVSKFDTGLRGILEAARRHHMPDDKVVVFIDDLDRCHPDKAVLILESIKHLLWVPGFVFVLALDHEILEAYLQDRYENVFGIKNDPDIGKRYLEKLVQLTLYLPESNKRFEDYVNELISPLEGTPLLPIEVAPLLIREAKYNPRQVKRRINDLIVDHEIFKRVSGSAKLLANDAEIVASMALNRLLREVLMPRDFRELITHQETADEVLFGINAKISIAYESESSERIVQILRQMGLDQMFAEGQPPRSWLENESLRKSTVEFLVEQRGQNSLEDPSQREIVDKAIRRSLNLVADHAISEDDRRRVAEVDLSSTELNDAGLELVKELTSLRELSLGETCVKDADLQHIKNLTTLEFLFLSGTDISEKGLKYLRSLTMLQKLWLNRTNVRDDGLKHLVGLRSLKELILSGTEVTNAGLDEISKLSSLQVLDLHGTKITDEGLGKLKPLSMLQSLSLFDTEITDVGLEHLMSIPTLLRLWIPSATVTAAGRRALRLALPNCTIHG